MSDQSSGGAPPPGWYPDPDNPDNRRWWDGLAWSTFSEPMGGGAPGPTGPGGFGHAAPATGGAAMAPQIDPWLWQSIVATILCCMPLGIAAIVFSAQAQTEISNGNHDLARQKARTAKTLTLWSAGVTLGLLVAWLLFVAVVGVASVGF